MLTHTGPTTQLGEGLLISLHIAGPCIIYSPNYLGCQELKKVFSPVSSSVWGAAPDYLYWYSHIAWWVMENGERVASRGHQLADSFLCLANKNKEGIVLHYHLLGLVSTERCAWASAAPGSGC